MTYTTKDSGERVRFASGFNRDIQTGKARYDLIPHELLTRLAELYARGAEKYGDCNWQKAESEEELQRFKASAWRHYIQWYRGDEDEDHAIATIWNIIAYEWLTKHRPAKPENLNPEAVDIVLSDEPTFKELKVDTVFATKVGKYCKIDERDVMVLSSFNQVPGSIIPFDKYEGSFVIHSEPVDE